MVQHNIFNGDSYHAIYSRIIYSKLMHREWVTLTSVMEEAIMKPLTCGVSKCEGYVELKKAAGTLRKCLKEVAGKDSIEEEGNNRDRRFRYIGKDPDPLRDMRNAKAIKDLGKYWQFCQDSAGFMPESWLEYFLNGSMDLLEIKKHKGDGEQVISCGMDKMLKNIEFLPHIYDAIKKKTVLLVRYQPFGREKQELFFSPHLLKEYNGRWHVLGHADGCEPEYAYYLALDRIDGKPELAKAKIYVPAPKGFYENFFKNVLGLTHKKSNYVGEIIVRAHSEYMFNLMDTKPMHHSQKVLIPFGQYEDGIYGDFSFNVELNNEFIGRILQMGEGLEIVGPPKAREVIKKRIARMNSLYAK